MTGQAVQEQGSFCLPHACSSALPGAQTLPSQGPWQLPPTNLPADAGKRPSPWEDSGWGGPPRPAEPGLRALGSPGCPSPGMQLLEADQHLESGWLRRRPQLGQGPWREPWLGCLLERLH